MALPLENLPQSTLAGADRLGPADDGIRDPLGRFRLRNRDAPTGRHSRAAMVDSFGV